MKTILSFLFCLIFSWHLSAGNSAPAVSSDNKSTADQLLSLSDDQNLENHKLAIQTAQKALALFQSVNDREGIAHSYFAIGGYNYASGNMDEASRNYEAARQIFHELQQRKTESQVLTQLGYVEGRKGEWLNGFSYLTQAQTVLDDDDAEVMAGITAGMGYFFNESGSPENGLIQYQRAHDYYLKVPDGRSATRQAMMVGYSYFLLRNYDAALSRLQQVLQVIQASGNDKADFDSAECEEYISQVYLATGKYDLALQHLLPVAAFYESKGNEPDAAQIKGLIGKAYEEMGQIPAARASYEAALKSFREPADPNRRAAVAFALGRLELSQNNYDAAESYLKESIDTTEDIRSDLKDRTLALAFSVTVHDRYETYIDCLMRKYKQQSSQDVAARAFDASELARARSLQVLLRETQTKTGIDPALAEQDRSLRQAIRAQWEKTIKLLTTAYKKDELKAAETTLTQLREQHQQLVRKLEKQNPNYDQIKEPANYSVQQIQERIVEDDETMLLEYFMGKNASYVWTITRNDVKAFELPKADVITDAVKVVYDLLSKPPDDNTEKRLNKASAELAQLVLTPLANQPNVKRVIVVADGALNYIPFQLLPAPSGNQALVANYEIVNAPSASILGQLHQEKLQRPATAKIVAAFGDPAFRSNYSQFKHTAADEAAAVAKATQRDFEMDSDSRDSNEIQGLVYSKYELKNLSEIAGSASLVKSGFDASRTVLEKTDFSKYTVLHFATHGRFNQKHPEQSGFYLATVDANGHDQDGFITMEDVYNLRVPVALVVLSACRTALGDEVRGEGLIGLTRGFMHAGASSVVASLWKVDDEATSELMKYFYTNMLKKGMRPAAALREAQNTLRQNPLWQSPHYWAAFTLQGEFKEPIIRLPRTASAAVQNAVGGALLFSLLAGIGWGFWRRLG